MRNLLVSVMLSFTVLVMFIPMALTNLLLNGLFHLLVIAPSGSIPELLLSVVVAVMLLHSESQACANLA